MWPSEPRGQEAIRDEEATATASGVTSAHSSPSAIFYTVESTVR